MNLYYHIYDLPADLNLCCDIIAVDTEAMGLNNVRDRLCVVQIGDDKGNAHIVHFPSPQYDSPNLKVLLSNANKTKLFHFARFDVAIIKRYLNIQMQNLYCTKIASKLARTYTDAHGLKDLCYELLGVKLSKQQRNTYWGTNKLTKEQLEYAATDVLYLHQLRIILNDMLHHERRLSLAQQCFNFIPTIVELDMLGWQEQDIFYH